MTRAQQRFKVLASMMYAAGIAGCFLFAAVAFAQDVAVPGDVVVRPAATVGEALTGLLITHIIPLVGSLISMVATGVLLPLVVKWLKSKAEAEDAGVAQKLAANAALKVLHFGEVVVADLNATMKAAYEKAAEDGKITADEAEMLKVTAVARMKELLAEQGLAEVKGALGVGEEAVNKYLGGIVELSVAKAKAAASPAAALANPS